MAIHDPHIHGPAVPPQQQASLEGELAAANPMRHLRGQKDPGLVAKAQRAEEMRGHLAASRKVFTDIRDDMWANKLVRTDTPFRYGHPPREPVHKRLTDNELRRGEMSRADAIVDRARRNEEDYKSR